MNVFREDIPEKEGFLPQIKYTLIEESEEMCISSTLESIMRLYY